MGFFIKRKRHLLTRLPIAILLILLIGFCPLLAGIVGAFIQQWRTGLPCNEGDCEWAVYPWLMLITIPIAGVLLLILLIITLIEIIILLRKDKG